MVYSLLRLGLPLRAKKDDPRGLAFDFLEAAGHPAGEKPTTGHEDGVITIDAAEAMFFDISGLNQASSWMNWHVFIPEAKFGSKELAAKLKMAHHGGLVVARALLDGQEHLPR